MIIIIFSVFFCYHFYLSDLGGRKTNAKHHDIQIHRRQGRFPEILFENVSEKADTPINAEHGR